MEATGEDLTLYHNIRPPSLENAGLEDCALSTDAIKEAFFKAASSVSSRAASILAGEDDEGGCVRDPWIDKTVPEDTLVGIEPEGTPPGPCAAGKGGALVGNGDTVSDVVVVGDGSEEERDEVVVVGVGQGGEGGGCVDGLRGLEIMDKKEESDKDDEQDGKKKPTLVEGFFLNP